MRNENGSAIVIVMIMMTILALAGAGLLIQSRMDTKLTKSRISYDRTINLADGASRIGLYAVRMQNADTFEYSGQQIRKLVSESPSTTRGYWDAFTILCGFSKTAPAGWELNQYVQHFWISQGTGSRAVAWATSKSYAKDELVSHNGTTFKCLVDGGSSEPGIASGWEATWKVVAPNQSVVQLPLLKVTRE
ncbi:MAG: carbohydrate-binding protein [Thermodesulfobacteriota bacterium]